VNKLIGVLRNTMVSMPIEFILIKTLLLFNITIKLIGTGLEQFVVFKWLTAPCADHLKF
jgi:hypothetical protein